MFDDEEMNRRVNHILDLSAATVPMNAMAIGQGKPFKCALFVGDDRIASFDAEEFFSDVTILAMSFMRIKRRLSALEQGKAPGDDANCDICGGECSDEEGG